MLYSAEPRTGTRGIRLSNHNVFWRQKILVWLYVIFCKRTCNIRRFAGCLLRGQLNSNGFKVFNGCVVELWILLVHLFSENVVILPIFQLSRFECPHYNTLACLQFPPPAPLRRGGCTQALIPMKYSLPRVVWKTLMGRLLKGLAR